MKVEESDGDRDGLIPPRKKLKQARLPFQILSPSGVESPTDKVNKKRKLSEDDADVDKVIKVVKPNETNPQVETKENVCTTTECDSRQKESKISKLKENAVKISGTNSSECKPNSEQTVTSHVSVVEEIIISDAEEGASCKNISKSVSSLVENKHLTETEIKTENEVELEGLNVDSKTQMNNMKVEVQCVAEEGSEPHSHLKKEEHDPKPKEAKRHTLSPNMKDNSEVVDVSKIEIECEENDSKNPDQSKDDTDLEVEGNCTPRRKRVGSKSSKGKESKEIKVTEHNTSPDQNSSTSDEISDSPKSLQTPKQKAPNSRNTTPKTRKLTPKQVLKQIESAKKKEERTKLKEEREKKKAEEKEEKQKQRLEQRKKEKEEKEQKKQAELEQQKQKIEQKKKEKEEKERKRLAELELKTEEKRAKEEERQQRLLEKRKKDEKKQAEEDAKRKEAAAFTSFFRASKAEAKPLEEVKAKPVENFMPFEVKADMRLAPLVRTCFDADRKNQLDHVLHEQAGQNQYMEQLSDKLYIPQKWGKTWPLSEFRDDVVIIDEDDEIMGGTGDSVVVECHPRNNLPRPKLLQFWDNRRPPYWGTWRKKSSCVKPRVPFGKDEKLFDYEVDSDDEWEEEEPGESLHGSDDEKESEDEYEVDNDFFVPHGYLSEEENECEEDESVSPETQKAKLKLLELVFEEEMKQKTECLKPRVIGCIWHKINTDPVGSRLLQLLSSHRAVFRDGPIVTSIPESERTGTSPDQDSIVDITPGPKKRKFPEADTPALIKLIHGNMNGRIFLVKEFYTYWLKKESANKCSDTDGKNVENNEGEGTPSSVNPNSISKKSISNKIKELASWIPCPDEGLMLNRMCWYVPHDIRSAHGLDDLEIPNKVWNYSHAPKREMDFSSSAPSPIVPCDINPKPAKKRPLITKFVKKMSHEELQKQFQQASNSSECEVVEIKQGDKQTLTPVHKTQRKLTSFKAKAAAKSTKPNEPRKRVPILMSVSRGQSIPKLCDVKLPPERDTSNKPILKEKMVENIAVDSKDRMQSTTTTFTDVECIVVSD